MDDDDYPQFDNAFPSSTTTPKPSSSSSPPAPASPAASWNPAFRANADNHDASAEQPALAASGAQDQDDDDDFFDRYPDATPKKPAAAPPASAEPVDEERRHSISVEHIVDVRHSTATPDDSAQGPHHEAKVEGPWASSREEGEGDEDDAETAQSDSQAAPERSFQHQQEQQDPETEVFRGPDETVKEQQADLESYSPDVPAEATQTLEDATEPTAHPSAQPGPELEAPESSLLEDQHPEDHYEHQGAVPEMEAAQDEEPDAPLLEDEEAPPTPGNISREPTFGMGTGSSFDSPARNDGPHETAHAPIERSFTSNFTDMPEVDSKRENTQTASIPEDPTDHEEWPPAVHNDEEWPAAGDDKTFGELLDDGETRGEQNAIPRERPKSGHSGAQNWPSAEGEGGEDDFSQMLGAGTDGASPARELAQDAAAQGLGDVAAPDGAAESAPEKEEDLAAAWSAALDDDDLLDEGTDPAKLFGDDDDLLDDSDDDFLGQQGATQPQQPATQTSGQQQSRQTSAPSTARAYTPQVAQQPASRPSPYAPNGGAFSASTPSLQNPALSRSGGTPDTGLGLFDLYNQPIPATAANPAIQQAQQQQRPELRQAQSFADKSKGGYQSPYDLPMEVVKPRRAPAPRVSGPQGSPQVGGGGMPGPPPRSSSFGAGVPPSSSQQQQQQRPQQGTVGTPVISGPPGTVGAPPPGAVQAPPSSAGGAPPPRAPSAGSGGSRPDSGTSAGGAKGATPNTGSGFFEDLPVAPKPRVRPSGAYTPQVGSRPGTGVGTPGPPMQGQMPPPPPTASTMGPPPSRGPPAPMQAPPPAVQQPPAGDFGGLRQPDRMPLLPDQPFAPQQAQQQPPPPPAAARYSPSQQTAPVSTAPPAVNRYSPAPSAVQPPAAASRYSPAPPPPAGQAPQPKRQMSAGPPGVGMNKPLPFAPRTSSPLAWSAEKEQQRERPQTPSEAAVQRIMSPPAMNGNASTAALSPERQASARYSPAGPATMEQQQGHQAAPPPPAASAPPPQRPRTQSPGATMKQQPRLAMTGVERPSSAAGLSYAPAAAPPTQPTSAYHPQNILHPQQQQQPLQPSTTQPTKGPILPHRRQFSRDLNFTAPQDDRSLDPLSRWKAGPIFHWSAGGTITTSFPTQTPFYAAGHGIPTLKVSSGDIKIEDTASLGLNEILFPEGEGDGAKFPGPLPAKAKGKKKEVLGWLGTKIEGLERKAEAMRMDFQGTEPGERVRSEEKVVLWKIVRCLVEGDGVLEGGGSSGSSGGKGSAIEEEVRKILLPDLQQMGQAMDLQSPTSTTTPGGGPSGVVEPGNADPTVLLQLRQALLEGQRERAVWLAEEKKLWGHAMLLASTLGPDVWKQIVQAFVRSQVKNAGSDASRSLAALYQIFAGNSEDCVDELVPPSARAGFRMVSRSDGSVSGNALEGLEKWRETLGLVVSNRTPNDGASLVALGKLLVSYGRVEAGHTCFLFARSLVKQSGADDPEAHFVLLGGTHKPSSPSASSVEGSPLGNDLDAIQLTEIYEWASSLSAPSTASPYQPYLQPYKLLHAQMLAAHGFKTKAQAYCDHITSAFTSTTRPSPYYHPTFTNAVAELTAFLQQAPQDGKGGSLFSRPAMKNLTNKSSNWFTKFVAGEDEPGAQGEGVGGGAPMGGMGGEDATPFGKVSGEFSRTESGTDLYNPMMMGGGMPSAAAPAMGTPGPYTPGAPAAQAAGGRYAPSPAAFGAGIPASSPMSMQQPPAGRYAPQQASSSSPAMAMGSSPQQQEGFMSQSPPSSSLGVPTAEPHPRPASTRSASGRYAPVTPSGLGTQSLAVPSGPSRAASDYGVGYGSAGTSRRGSAQDPGSQGSYEPTPSFMQEPSAQSPYQPQAPPSQAEEQDDEPEDPFAKPPNGDLAAGTGFGGADDDAEGGGYQPPSSSYEPPASSYEPPGYQPYEPEAEAAEEEQASQPKKKGMMDLSDDEDDREMERRAAALKQQQKSDADRQADEAFRKAAEADAARDNNKSSGGSAGEGKKGWLTGWFSGSGKKDQPQDLNKPIRAKLGEENSFYYDENLKKWVNKKAGPEAAQQSSAAATPPPPKGGPSRVASGVGAGPPPSGPPSRVGSAAGMMPPPPPGAGASRPGTSGSYTAAGGPPGSGPPSRAGTPATEASPAIGGPAASAGGGDVASGPPSRPPTGLSNASSLDDLLGGPPGPGGAGGRKAGGGGTAKGRKKGAGRYVDVMAK
ncbi:hypothetical protein KC343_g2464 [Hortaea werneckii]|uniref:Protein transport protein sec16 n=1 Tax=Hortaea werneckii TaxID=91943 RepID=A0A3M7GVX1_HORWE|nr:hypothetical protein KC323_g2588 [Hortaea werneckii]KAI7570061.1 hypothetical protein KC317_g2797 [Hortaea werneckii]KAI7624082.1 hypothetical protein KC346_g2392 [Hortaea werneckii]KAI7634307.1 hypothetical protein KC343_g2464 [Hortaea werneckii]KAI7716285.1 hypothetical protein KC322_g2679 [Hortaea werneckii]